MSSLGERHSQQILILPNDTQALTHSLEVLLMSLVCGYGVEPDWLHAQTDGSSVRCHRFLLCSPASFSESGTLQSAVVIKAGKGLPEGLRFNL